MGFNLWDASLYATTVTWIAKVSPLYIHRQVFILKIRLSTIAIFLVKIWTTALRRNYLSALNPFLHSVNVVTNAKKKMPPALILSSGHLVGENHFHSAGHFQNFPKISKKRISPLDVLVVLDRRHLHHKH